MDVTMEGCSQTVTYLTPGHPEHYKYPQVPCGYFYPPQRAFLKKSLLRQREFCNLLFSKMIN